MKNTIRSLFLLVVLLFFQLLMGQELLEAIVTWDAGDSILFKCANPNQRGSDLNNDGFDDYMSITFQDYLQFYLGGIPLNGTYNFELECPHCSGYPTWGGDLNGDGYKDIVWCACEYWGDAVDSYICLGAEEIDLEPELVLSTSEGVPLNGGFDFNGDGYDDLLLYGYIEMLFGGFIRIYPGAEEFSTEQCYSIQGESEEWFGSNFAVCDLNGDGYDDLIASRGVGYWDYACLLEIYLGGEEFDLVCDYIIPDTLSNNGNYVQLPTGDINGDGREELIIYSQESSLRTYNINDSGELVAEDYDIVTDGKRIVADINGDGIDDLVCWNRLEEIVAIYYGGDTIDFGYDAYFNVADCTGSDDRWFICGLGDVNGDGEDEILVNDGDGTGNLGTTATVYGLHSNDNDECKIENVKCKIDNYPNPFNPSTRIEFELMESAEVELAVYNLKGQLVTLLEQGEMSAGRHFVDWDGRSGQSGQSVSSGIYFCRLASGGKIIASKKMLLLK
ncbi:MAG: FG-GAP-like repeat-containing protein [Candidatus Cloacimonetes bacterium]|nr:FG-GAP-like repeat-containing protein [Candidatus Cloacimonadota bacterium]